MRQINPLTMSLFILGYAGTDCEINFDDCASTPCFNNATCADDVAAYRCLCKPGFTGEQCQVREN